MLFDRAQKKLWRHGLIRCEHRRSWYVTITTAAGARGIREQCLDCGCLDSAPHKLADHPEAPAADMAAAARWQEFRDRAGKAAQLEAQKRHAMREAAKPAEDADWWAAYDEFLRGDVWHALRAMVLHRDQGRCTAMLPGCQRQAKQVHHDGPAAYAYHRRIGATPAYLLRAVCVACHETITQADRAERGQR
jgi:5-methylcytosine-specific restriction endonuclease McrA